MSTAQEHAHQQMIYQQVRTWDVFDPDVLAVLATVRREIFVPDAFRSVAFADTPVPLGHDQIMLPPSVDGRILNALAVKPTDEVLDVGTGSGFLAACLGLMAERVRSLELYADLAEHAAANLHAAAANNVLVEIADATQLNEGSRYDAIAVTGSLPFVGAPQDNCFARALKPGGRLFVVVGQAPVMEALRIVRIGPNEWRRESLFETVIPPLVNAPRPSPFVF